MIIPKKLIQVLKNQINFITGVPDSVLKVYVLLLRDKSVKTNISAQ